MFPSRLISRLRYVAVVFGLGWRRLRSELRRTRLGGSSPIRLVVRVFRRLGDHDAAHLAAGVSYYAVLSLFPLVLALSAVIGWIAGPESRQDQLVDFIVDNLPGSEQFVRDTVQGAEKYRETLGAAAVLGLIGSASVVFGSVTRVVNRAWGLRANPPFYKNIPRQLAMALGVGILFLISLASTSVLQWAGSIEVDGESITSILGGQFVAVVLRLSALLISFLMFLIIYKYVPSIKAYWRDVWLGALLAGLFFELGKFLFLWYLENFARFEQLYGNVASVAVLMIWVYFCAFVLIIGAEVSSEYGRLKRGELSLRN